MKRLGIAIIIGILMNTFCVQAQTSKERGKVNTPTKSVSHSKEDGKVKTQITLHASDQEVEALKKKHKAPIRSDYKSDADYKKAKETWIRKHREIYEKITSPKQEQKE